MLGLVLAESFLFIYIFWELVGLSSYLLIGFWFEKKSASDAAKKAFVVNRVGDFGFALGIMLIFLTFHSIDFTEVFSAASHGNFAVGSFTVTIITLLLFMGATGKSAQIPLYTWLPDAMEGPTPVSALIHAATMVTAGVYMIARCNVLYMLSPFTMTVVASVGAVTALFAASIGLVQNDIKRVLAYSTISQLGYMFLACGVGAFSAGIFHVMTHAFFKALLFLGAGSVIHAMHNEQDIQNYGGLKKYLPYTAITFLIAALAISGIPPLSGFFSKDEILVAAFESNRFLFFVEYAVAGITAFYMFRLYFNVFWGKSTHYHHTPHESPFTMTIPLMVLALASMFTGFIPFSDLVTSNGEAFTLHTNWLVAIPSVLIGMAGIALAWVFYKKETAIPDQLATTLSSPYKWSFNKFYIDEVYLFVTKKIIFDRVSEPIAWFDRHVVDASMNRIAWVTNLASDQIKGLQSGQLQKYGFIFISGVIILTFTFVYFLFN